jgi:serine protease Do
MTTFNRKTLFVPTLLSCLMAAAAVQPQSACADAAIYRQTLNSTTWVITKGSEGTSSGTGVLVDAARKLVVTNAHVVSDARNAVVFFPEIKNDRPVVERSHYLTNVKTLGVRGRVVAVDKKRDLAIIELDKLPEHAVAITMADSSAGPGEAVDSIGNPGATEALWVYTSGTVRTVYLKKFRTGAGEHEFTVVETQSPINSGDSGGPVVNKEGKLVAIAQAVSPKARLVSYCVDISEVKAFIDSPWKPAPLPVEEILKRTELTYTKHDSGHFQVEFDGSDKESKQTVFIAKEVEYYERADIRKVWTFAETLTEQPTQEVAMKLLAQSSRTKVGSWAIEQAEDGNYLVMFVVKMDATAAPDAVESTMQYVAKLAVAMKKELNTTETASSSETLDDWLGN